MNYYFSVLFLFLGFFVASCDVTNTPTTPKRDNPTDPSSPSFQSPKVEITEGIPAGTITPNYTVSFAWRGNLSDEEMLFSYRMDNANWSSYALVKSSSFEYLDEGGHTFSVKSKYLNNIEQTNPVEVIFLVDAVKGTALMFLPRKTSVLKNNVFELEIMVEEATDFAGAKIVIQYDKNIFSLESAPEVYKDSKSILLKYGGSILDFVESNPITGIITYNLAIAGGATANVSGTGKIGKLRFKAIGNQGTRNAITISNSSSLRKDDNTSLAIQSKESAVVDIK